MKDQDGARQVGGGQRRDLDGAPRLAGRAARVGVLEGPAFAGDDGPDALADLEHVARFDRSATPGAFNAVSLQMTIGSTVRV